MSPDVAKTMEVVNELTHLIDALTKQLINLEKGWDTVKDNLHNLSSGQTAEIERIDFGIDYLKSKLSIQELNKIDKIFEQTTPKNIVSLNKAQLQELINLLESIKPLTVGASATLNDEDRKRLVELYEEYLRQRQLDKEFTSWKTYYEQQIRTYLRSINYQLQQEYPQHAAAFEVSAQLIRVAILEDREKRISQSPQELFREISERVQKEIDFQRKILVQQQALSPKQQEAAEKQLAAETIAAKQQTLSQLENFQTSVSADPRLATLVTDQIARIQRAIKSGEIPTDAEVESFAYRSLIIGTVILPKQYKSLTRDQAAQLAIIVTPMIMRSYAALVNDKQGLNTTGNIQGDYFEEGKKLPATEVQKLHERLQNKVQNLLDIQGGTITEQQFRVIQSQLAADLQVLKDQGFNKEQILITQRELLYLKRADIMQTAEIEGKPGIEVRPIDQLGQAVAAGNLSQQELVRLLLQYEKLHGKLSAKDAAALLTLAGSEQAAVTLQQLTTNSSRFEQTKRLVDQARIDFKTQTETAKENFFAKQRRLEQLRFVEERMPREAPARYVVGQTGYAPILAPQRAQPSGSSGGLLNRGLNLATNLARARSTISTLATGARTITLLSQWWFWVIIGIVAIILIFFVVTGVVTPGAFNPTNLNPGAGPQGNDEFNLASGSCPIPPPYHILQGWGIYDPVRNTGHGSDFYWSKEKGPYLYPIPDNHLYPACWTPTGPDGDESGKPECKYYGLAIDVVSNTTPLSPVVAPRVCAKGDSCTTNLEWYVETVEQRKFGYAVVLKSVNDPKHTWRTIFIHLQKPLVNAGDRLSSAEGKNLVGYLGPFRTPHVHFEITMDGIPVDPTPFCDGKDDGGGPVPGPGGGGSCSVPTNPENYCYPGNPKLSPNISAAFGDQKNNAAITCRKESYGDPAALNAGCLKGRSAEYSVGLYQINVLVHPIPALMPPDLRNQLNSAGANNCVDGFNWAGGLTPNCSIKNQKVVDICRKYFSDPENNIKYAAGLQKISGWGPWSGAKACGIR